MKTINIISGIAFTALMVISSVGYTQIAVHNNTCHSMFVTAQWGTYNSSCTKCTGCNSSGTVADNTTGSIPGTGPDLSSSEEFLWLTATLNSYSGCTVHFGAVTDCNGYVYYGESNCCEARWIVYGIGDEIYIDPY